MCGTQLSMFSISIEIFIHKSVIKENLKLILHTVKVSVNLMNASIIRYLYLKKEVKLNIAMKKLFVLNIHTRLKLRRNLEIM